MSPARPLKSQVRGCPDRCDIPFAETARVAAAPPAGFWEPARRPHWHCRGKIDPMMTVISDPESESDHIPAGRARARVSRPAASGGLDPVMGH